jgi:hypothetical protein
MKIYWAIDISLCLVYALASITLEREKNTLWRFIWYSVQIAAMAVLISLLIRNP